MDETVEYTVGSATRSVRVLFIARTAAESLRWTEAASQTVAMRVTVAPSFAAAIPALVDEEFDAVVVSAGTHGDLAIDVLRMLGTRNRPAATIVIGGSSAVAATLAGHGAFAVIDDARIDDLGRALSRAFHFRMLSRPIGAVEGASSVSMLPPALIWTTSRDLRIVTWNGAHVVDSPGGISPFIGVAIDEPRLYRNAAMREAAVAAHLRALRGESARYEVEWEGALRRAQVDPLHDRHGAIVGAIAAALERTTARGVAGRAHAFDALTGMPNRSSFDDRLGRAIGAAQSSGKRVAIVFLDVDRFRAINDLGTYATGDDIIKSLGERLQRACTADDVVFRFGGDEFVLVRGNVAPNDDPMTIADALLADVRVPFIVDGREVRVTASAGISLYPRDGADATTLVSKAECAMYEAKHMGRNTAREYVESYTVLPNERIALLADLHHAIDRGELEVYYQPMYDIGTRSITGVEALLRWLHPVHGMVSPDTFIPMAEESGAIDAIGDWVMGRACEQIRAWTDAGIPHVRVSVNVSARQLEKGDFLDRIDAHLKRCGIAPASLEIEVTETAIMRDVSAAIRLLNDIKELGIRVAIDDFGTGYTSLRFLKRFPVDVLKIDKSFIRDVATGLFDGAIVRAVTTLARTLGVATIAEGVELESQFDRLRDLQCDQVQGFLFSKPMTALQCTPLLWAGALPAA